MEETNLYDTNSAVIEKVQKSLHKARKIVLKEKNFTANEKLSEIETVTSL